MLWDSTAGVVVASGRRDQGIAQELPREQRLEAIEAQISRMGGKLPANAADVLQGTSFSDLFKAIQLRDMPSILKLQQQLSREVARWQAGGGPTGRGTGLLAPEQR